jgi:hypothetical protein
MIKEHKQFIQAVVVFSIIFWGTYFVAMRLIPWMYYSNSKIDPGFAEMLERQVDLDESKL